MKRSRFTIVVVAIFAVVIYSGFAPRVLAQPVPPAPAGNPPLPPGPWMMERQGMGGPGMMGGPGRPNFPPDLMTNRMRRMHEFEQQGCGGMGPEMWRGPGMGMGIPSDAKTRAQLLQLRGKVMQMYGEWMEKRGNELEQQAK